MGKKKYEFDKLTPREREVAALVYCGFRSAEIASILDLSVRTVEVHRFNASRYSNRLSGVGC